MDDEISERIDLGTWGFLRTGWWVLHIVGLAVVAYAGYYFFRWIWG